VDTAVLKPVSEAYGIVVPHPIRHVISNELQHLRLPGIFINRVLQGDVEQASAAVGRFGINTVIGLAGLLDPATEFGLPFTPTDFGVTMAVWGVDEGIYHELPLFGPATTRDAVGRVVNFALDPAFLVTTGVVELSGAVAAANTARTPVEVVNTRHENAELIDNVLYASDDSYVTARTGYVQFRRRLVSGETQTEDLPDIFAD
jgi:phospholipid-binding lipoprotein MlaA